MPYCYRRKTDMEHSAQTHSIDKAPRASTKRREPARSAREKMKEKKGKERLSLPFTTSTPLCCRSMNPALVFIFILVALDDVYKEENERSVNRL